MDSGEKLPYAVQVRHAPLDSTGAGTDTGAGDGDGQWREVVKDSTVAALRMREGGVYAVRVVWESTDLHKMGGLSTARSGGGLHVAVFGEQAS